MVRAEPTLEQLADGQERRGPPDGTTLGPLGGELLAVKLGLFGAAVEGKERCTVRPETGSTPTAMRISHTPGLRSRMVPVPHAMREK